ncbi:MAG: 50S ribosomal protein L31e [Nanoarchaeota archaeon]
MAKKEESKQVLERTYIIPLRSKTLKVPPYRKAKKAVRAVREFLTKHMKSEDVYLGRHLNMKLWEHGMKNPPHHIKVTVTKDDKGKVVAELFGAKIDVPKVDEKKSSKKETKADTKEEKLEAEVKEAKEEKATEAKKIEKEEIKELKKEHPKVHATKMTKPAKENIVHNVAPKSA